MREYFVYLSGPITGLSYDEAKDGWRGELWAKMVELRALGRITLLSPMRRKEHLRDQTTLSGNGYKAEWDAIVARDLADVRRADLIVMNLIGAKRVSIGTMAELGMARMADKPVLLIAPTSWTGDIHDHGWVRTIPMRLVYTLDDAADFITDFCSDGL